MEGYSAEIEEKMQRLACDPKTIRQGLRDLEATEDGAAGRIRTKGGAAHRA
jgi:hypothetical protein